LESDAPEWVWIVSTACRSWHVYWLGSQDRLESGSLGQPGGDHALRVPPLAERNGMVPSPAATRMAPSGVVFDSLLCRHAAEVLRLHTTLPTWESEFNSR
jgi:hypothetical protein